MEVSASHKSVPLGRGDQATRLHRLVRGDRARRAPAARAGADHGLHPPQHAARLRGPAVPRGGQERGAGLRLPAVPDPRTATATSCSAGGSGSRSCRRCSSRTWATRAGERDPLLRHPARPAAGDAPVSAADRARPRSWSGTSPRRTRCGGSGARRRRRSARG